MIRRLVVSLTFALALAAGVALASGPTWMTGFPMRMGPNVMLMWSPVPGATSYNLYRSLKAGELGEKVGSLPMNNHMDANVPADKDVFYTVKAVLADGKESAAGPVATLVGTKPLDPPKWIGELHQNNQLSLRWEAQGGAAFYNVFKAEAKAGPFTLLGSVQETKYVDPAVEAGKTYWYQLAAVDKTNVESPRSAVLETTIPKAVVPEVVKSWPFAEKVMGFTGFWRGEAIEIKGPGDLAIDAKAGVIYLCADNAFYVLDLQGNVTGTINKPADYQGDWGRPLSVTLAEDGTLWTTWAPNLPIRQLGRDGKLLREFRLEVPKADYERLKRDADWEQDKLLKPQPYGIAVDPQGRLWVADNNFFQLSVVNSEGKLLKRIGEPRPRGFEPHEFRALSLVKYHAGTDRVYVLDPMVSVLRAFTMKLEPIKDQEGKPNWGWSRPGSSVGFFSLAKGFGFTPEGDIAVLDAGSLTLQVFDPDMEYKHTIVEKAGEKQLRRPAGPMTVAFTRDRVIISDKLGDQMVTLKYVP